MLYFFQTSFSWIINVPRLFLECLQPFLLPRSLWGISELYGPGCSSHQREGATSRQALLFITKLALKLSGVHSHMWSVPLLFAFEGTLMNMNQSWAYTILLFQTTGGVWFNMNNKLIYFKYTYRDNHNHTSFVDSN